MHALLPLLLACLVPQDPPRADMAEPTPPPPPVLGDVARGAAGVAAQLEQGHADDDVLARATAVEEDLTALIASLERGGGGDGDSSPEDSDEAVGQAGRGGESGAQGLTASTLAGGPGGAGEPRATGGADTGPGTLGALPPHLREKVLQARRAGFPPDYEALLADYYRRLAREEDAPAHPPGGGGAGDRR